MELKDVKELVRFFDRSGLSELEIENGEERIYLSKAARLAQEAAAPIQQHPDAVKKEEKTSETPEKDGLYIESPMIGTFYAAPSQGATPFVKVGDVAEKGQTLCIIEAMKIMNTIEADYRCRIADIFVVNGDPVEYGQPIFLVETV